MATLESPPEVMLSVCCITYNHVQFIEEALESFLNQITAFSYEIIVGDDCSNDGTYEILQRYTRIYPDKVKLVQTTRNAGTHQNMLNAFNLCSGKYLALCDGDDFWTNPLKLQKQVDFLEANDNYVICCHYTRVIDQDYNELYVHPSPVPLIHTYNDLLAGKQEETKTATVVCRNLPAIHRLLRQHWFYNTNAGDKFFKLYATGQTKKHIYVMPEIMSCYRNHTGGVWSMINENLRRLKMISDFNIIIKYFTIPIPIRRRMLILYLRRYFLFEIRSARYGDAFRTIRQLI